MTTDTFITLGLDGFFQRMFFGADSGTTDMAVKTDALFMLVWWHGVFWFVVLMGLMFYWVIKYRRRPGVPAQVSPSHNTPLEVFWTVVPSSALLVIFLLGFWGYMEKLTPAQGAIQLDVQASMWSWTITYPGGQQSDWVRAISEFEDEVDGSVSRGENYPVFVVPEDTEISLKMISADVIHAFWIPAIRTKMDVYPNRYTGYGFRTPLIDADDQTTHPKTGEPMPGRDLVVFCAEYCGDKHSQMAATLRVVPKQVYTEILDEWDIGNKTPVEIGEGVWKIQCAICHTNNGAGNTGPTWLGEPGGTTGWGYDVTLNNGSTVLRDDNYVRESILDPQSKIVGGFPGSMPPFQGRLSEAQISGIIAYYRSLSDRGRAAQAEEIPATDGAPDGAESDPGDQTEDTPAGDAGAGR